MKFLQTVFQFIDADMERPMPYGWFHLMFVGITILGAILLCLFRRYRMKKGKDTAGMGNAVVLATALLVAALEIYKQIVYSFSISDGQFVYDYQWYAFPWQFCSMPMYAGLLVGVFRRGKIHDALMAFLATYAVFAGICVMIYPVDVFIGTIGINIQTMVCHGSMISVGVFLFCAGYVKTEHRTILKAIPVFAAAVLIASVLNEVAYFSGLLERETFNMFFVSPHCEPSLPVYSAVQALVPFPWCLIVYILVFSLAAYVILLLGMGVEKLWRRAFVRRRT